MSLCSLLEAEYQQKMMLMTLKSFFLQCFLGSELLKIFSLNVTVGITEHGLTELCPALLQQTLSGICSVKMILQFLPPSTEQSRLILNKQLCLFSVRAYVRACICACMPVFKDFFLSLPVYGYGTLAILVISLGSLLGGALIPCIKGRPLEAVMMTFIAMAIGTLIGDSLLHLLPMVSTRLVLL